MNDKDKMFPYSNDMAKNIITDPRTKEAQLPPIHSSEKYKDVTDYEPVKTPLTQDRFIGD